MDFKKKLKKRQYVAISYILVGLVLIIADVLNRFDNYFIFAFGFALVVMGIARLLRYRKITKDESSIRAREVAETDERFLMMSERARSWAFSFSVMAGGILVILLSLLGRHEEALPFAWYVCIQTLLYWICWNILRKKY